MGLQRPILLEHLDLNSCQNPSLIMFKIDLTLTNQQIEPINNTNQLLFFILLTITWKYMIRKNNGYNHVLLWWWVMVNIKNDIHHHVTITHHHLAIAYTLTKVGQAWAAKADRSSQ